MWPWFETRCFATLLTMRSTQRPTYHLTPRAHLLLAIEALKFAMEQKAAGAETRRKIGVALASARRDLAQLKPARKSKR